MTPVFRVEHSSAEPQAWAVAGPRPDDWREPWARTLGLVRGVCAWCSSTGADTIERGTGNDLRAVHRACVGYVNSTQDTGNDATSEGGRDTLRRCIARSRERGRDRLARPRPREPE